MATKPRENILVCYDVRTTDLAGERRLRRVAKVCERYGQRVQQSVFECSVTIADLERFLARLVKEIKASEDSLLVYTIGTPRDRFVRTFGVDRRVDFEGPLVL